MTAIAERVTIGQQWRRRDGLTVRIRQVHRADRLVEIDLITPRLFATKPGMLSFRELRRNYREVPS
jgi:hypothetical protein